MSSGLAACISMQSSGAKAICGREGGWGDAISPTLAPTDTLPRFICGSGFGTTPHDDAHDAFMTLPAYTSTKEHYTEEQIMVVEKTPDRRTGANYLTLFVIIIVLILPLLALSH